MCDELLVAICNDNYVYNIKNKELIFSENDRVRILSSLKIVDKVILVNAEQATDKLLIYNKIKFDVLFSGEG